MLGQILRWIVGLPENRDLPLWNADDESSPFAVSGAVEWLVRLPRADRTEFAHSLAGVMRRVRPNEWRCLYANSHSLWIRPGHVAKLEELPADDAVEMLGVATLSFNGYAREAALHALGRLGHPRGVPYVLLRLGDWVEQVRRASLATLRMLMDRGVADALIEHRGLIERLRVVQRVDLSSVETEIRARLQAASSRPAVEAGLEDERAGTRLFCLRLLEGELRHQPDLVQRALGDRDPAVRIWMAGTIADGKLHVDEAVFRSLLRDKSSRISSIMIRSLTPEQVVTYRSELTELALADARAVRDSARFVLGRAESIDFAAAYRSRLESVSADAIRPGWVAGLGETGDASDFERIVALLDTARSRVRAAAVTAAGRLDRDRAAPMAVRLLADWSGAVRRAALGVLTEAPPALWTSHAYETLRTGPERGKAAALRALSTLGSWDVIPSLLHGLRSDSALVESLAWQGIVDWHLRYSSRGWIKPSSECRQQIRDVWWRVRTLEDAPDMAAEAWSSVKRRIGEVASEGVQ